MVEPPGSLLRHACLSFVRPLHCFAQMAKQIDFMHKILKGEYEEQREAQRERLEGGDAGQEAAEGTA